MGSALAARWTQGMQPSRGGRGAGRSGCRPVLSPVLSHSLLLRWLQAQVRPAPNTALGQGCLPPQAPPLTGKAAWTDWVSWPRLGHPQGRPAQSSWGRSEASVPDACCAAGPRGPAAGISDSGPVSGEPALGFQRWHIALCASGVHPVIAGSPPAVSSLPWSS